jgi:cellulose synthase/poly-beta-1,6-N-acetylglucosamine synthase-like glycosyltransferase
MGIGIPWFPPITLSIDALSLGGQWIADKFKGNHKNGLPDISYLYDNGTVDIIDFSGSSKSKVKIGSDLYDNGSIENSKTQNKPLKPKKDVTVVISAHGSEKIINDAVKEVFNQNYPIKNVYISDSNIDNTKKVVEELREKFPNVHYWSRDGITGKAEKINYLAMDPDVDLGDYVYFMDSQTKLNPDVIEKLVLDFARNGDNLGAVTSYGYVTPPKNYSATYFHFGKEWTNRIGKFRKTAQQNRRAMFVICGASFMVKSDVLKDVKIPHDTKSEDSSYTWRLQEEGYKVRAVQNAVVHAEDVPTLGKQINQTLRWYTGTWENIWSHKGKIFNPFSKGRNLGYTTVIPGVFEATLYSGAILSLPIVYYFLPEFGRGFLIGDTLLSFAAPAIGFALGGNIRGIPKELYNTARHYHQITGYKVMSSALWMYSGAKTAFDIATGNSKKWTGEWKALE